MLRLMQQMNTMSQDQFQADVLAMGTEYEKSNPILAGMGEGWTPALLNICCPAASKHLIANFVKTMVECSVLNWLEQRELKTAQ